jgi:CelD/BcsL family acetyltransferase involved in cellulose biosynthesis
MGSWHVTDLQELRPTAAALSILQNWDGLRTYVWQSNCVVIDAKPWDEVLMSLSKNHRKIARRTLRRAEADGLGRELAGPDEVERAARSLVTLSRDQWRERWWETSPEHWTQRSKDHLEAASCRMTACGLGGISEFRRDKATVVSTFLIFGRDFVGAYIVAASQEALKLYSFSSLYIWDALDRARNRNLACISLLRGEEQYKLRWNPRIVPNHRIVLGRTRVVWSLYAAYHILRSRIKRYTYSEEAPWWIKEAKNKHRILRYGATRYIKSGSIPRRIKYAAVNWLKRS